ncbi:MAG: NAD(P)/FAD-dependent oxidoreductase [Firmicutes bacterium]|nr:NAD(P)/FAD-dependent oxidoreductase [Bacillota bacterium]
MNPQNILIIGGGASGIVAAIIAKRAKASVTILERNPRIGKKILATGNGRCNFTNIFATNQDYNHPEFALKALETFGPHETIHFFEELGITPKTEELGKTFPLSEQASSMVDVLLYELDKQNVIVRTDSYVQKIVKTNDGFTAYLPGNSTLKADKVILCTGGKAMPKSGSDGSGFVLAKQLGHHITPIFPALVKLKLNCPYLKQLDGVKIPGTVELIHNGEVLQVEKGDILFTSYGISGPTILQLSRKANQLLLQHEEITLKVILVDSLSKEQVKRRFDLALDKPIDFSLVGLINKRLISAILKEAGVTKQNSLVSDVDKNQVMRIVDLLFDWRFTVNGSKSFEDAQVTAGGIDILEINKNTMESTLIPGLYFAGEIIDIDGLCGGFNLQWAWSSGYLAGKNASIRGSYDSNH